MDNDCKLSERENVLILTNKLSSIDSAIIKLKYDVTFLAKIISDVDGVYEVLSPVSESDIVKPSNCYEQLDNNFEDIVKLSERIKNITNRLIES